MTKTYRQGQILKLIRAKRVSTQEEIAQELAKQGIAATQVTLSRDIRDLRLVKTREGYQEMAAEETGPGIRLARGRIPAGRADRAEPGDSEDLARPRQFRGRLARWRALARPSRTSDGERSGTRSLILRTMFTTSSVRPSPCVTGFRFRRWAPSEI